MQKTCKNEIYFGIVGAKHLDKTWTSILIRRHEAVNEPVLTESQSLSSFSITISFTSVKNYFRKLGVSGNFTECSEVMKKGIWKTASCRKALQNFTRWNTYQARCSILRRTFTRTFCWWSSKTCQNSFGFDGYFFNG